VLAFALGAGRLMLELPRFDEHSLSAYNDGGEVMLEGVVTDEPSEGDGRISLRVQVERLWLADGSERVVRGSVLVWVPAHTQVGYGDRLHLEGELETPAVLETFSYREYLARQGIYSTMGWPQVTRLATNQASPLLHAILLVKGHARAAVATILPEPQAALLTGILLGDDSGLPDDVEEDFINTGTSHVIAISGFNMTLLAAVFARSGQRLFDRRRAFWVAIGGVALYTVLVGGSAAVVRAAIMSLLCMWGHLLGRRSHGPTSLAAVALAMTLANPHVLWDVSFQLSFAATAGLVLLSRPFERGFERAFSRFTSAEHARAAVRMLNEPVIVGLAAQIFIMPIVLVHFGRLSLVSFLSNLLILPAQTPLLLTGGLATLAGMAVRPLGRLAGFVAWPFLAYTIEMVRLTARIPFASLPVRVGAWSVLAYYLVAGGLAWWLALPPRGRQRLRKNVRALVDRVRSGRMKRPGRVTQPLLAGLGALVLVGSVLIWPALPDGRLHVTFLDVGQGDAIFIRAPGGRQVLIDGGPDEATLLSQLGRRMPFWDRTLDLVILTHPDLDHLTGLIGALERYQVEAVVWRDVPTNSPAYDRWLGLLEAEGVSVHQGEAGLHIALDEGLELTVLYPGTELLPEAVESANNASVVTRLTYGSVSVLLPGDIEAAVEADLVREGLPLAATVLKVAHHGSCSSTGEEFLRAVAPAVAVISVGENEFGHPCDEVLSRLADAQLYRTDQTGTVELVSDGAQIWVRTER
jgi:competence protein ComEC